MTLLSTNAVRDTSRRGRQLAKRIKGIEAALGRGDYETALANAQFALRRFAGDARLQFCAGRAAQALGRYDDAIAHFSSARTDPSRGLAPALALGDVLLCADRPRDAVTVYLQCTIADSADAAAADGAARALTAAGDPQRALDFHVKALRLEPRNAQYLFALGTTFLESCLYTDARKTLELAATLEPANADVARSLVLAHYYCATDNGPAVAAKLSKLFPKDARLMLLHAEMLKAANDMEAARAVLRRAIKIAPTDPEVLSFYVNAKAGAEADLSRRLDAALSDPVAAQSQNLHFARAAFLKAQGEDARAYDAYCRANAVAKAASHFDITEEQARNAHMKEIIQDTEQLECSLDPDAPVPIFIVGLPRSGSTLTEHILAAHPDVTPLGETTELRNAIRRLRSFGAETTRAAMERVQTEYYASAPMSRVRTRFAVDKNLGNFRYLGQILHAFPQARILHVVRDPKAVAWSIFQQSFNVESVPYAFDPEDIIAYHAAYRDLMQFWCARYGDRILTLDYDDLVSDHDAQIRQLLADLGLSWHPGCLAPHKVKRTVSTVSQSQVRREIYQGSSQAWRRFEPYAGPWLNRLPPTWRG